MRHGVYGVLVCSPPRPAARAIHRRLRRRSLRVLLAPSNGAQIANSAQPVTLAVQNAVLAVAATYTRGDRLLANKVQTKSGGWRERVTSLNARHPGRVGLLLARPGDRRRHNRRVQSRPVHDRASVTITAPTALSPANGATVPTTPTLTVINATSTGPAGPIAYRFGHLDQLDVRDGTVTGSVVAGASQASFTPSSALAANTKFYWRAGRH